MNRKRRINGVVVRVPKRLLVYRDYQRKCRTWVDWKYEQNMANAKARIEREGLTGTAAANVLFKAFYYHDIESMFPSVAWWDPNYKPHPSTLWEVVT